MNLGPLGSVYKTVIAIVLGTCHNDLVNNSLHSGIIEVAINIFQPATESRRASAYLFEHQHLYFYLNC